MTMSTLRLDEWSERSEHNANIHKEITKIWHGKKDKNGVQARRQDVGDQFKM